MFRPLVDHILTLLTIPISRLAELPHHYPNLPCAQATRLLLCLTPNRPRALAPYRPPTPGQLPWYSPVPIHTLQESTEMELRIHLAHGRVPIRLIEIPLARGSRIEYEDIHKIIAFDQHQPMCPVHQDVGQLINEGDEVIVSQIIRSVQGWRPGVEN